MNITVSTSIAFWQELRRPESVTDCMYTHLTCKKQYWTEIYRKLYNWHRCL